ALNPRPCRRADIPASSGPVKAVLSTRVEGADDVCVEATQGLPPVVAVQFFVLACCVPGSVADPDALPSHPVLIRQIDRKIQVTLMSRIVPLNQSKNSRRPGMSSHQRRRSRGVKTEVQRDDLERPIGARWRLTMRRANGE